MKKWTYKHPLISSLILDIFYLFIAKGMIFGNSFNLLNNGVILMIAVLFIFHGMMIKDITANAKEATKLKKQIIWGIFALVIIYIIYYSKLLGL